MTSSLQAVGAGVGEWLQPWQLSPLEHTSASRAVASIRCGKGAPESVMGRSAAFVVVSAGGAIRLYPTDGLRHFHAIIVPAGPVSALRIADGERASGPTGRPQLSGEASSRLVPSREVRRVSGNSGGVRREVVTTESHCRCPLNPTASIH